MPITRKPNLFPSNNKSTKQMSNIANSIINIATDQKKIQMIKKVSTNITHIRPFDYGSEIMKKAEPSSYRSSKDNKLPFHSKKNSEITFQKDLAAIFLKGSSLKLLPQEEKKCQSLKKHHHHNKTNSTGKLIRTNSMFYHHDNMTSNYNNSTNPHNSSNYFHNNTSGIINVNTSNIGFGMSVNNNVCNNSETNTNANNINANVNGNIGGNSNMQYVNELKQTIGILINYIETMDSQLGEYRNKIIKEKDEEIKKLKVENEYLKGENTQLKLKLLEVLYTAKVFDLNELKRKSNANVLMSQLSCENNYLRQANGDIRQIELSYCNCNCNSDNKSERGTITKDSLYTQSKHKRQKTHIKLTSILPEEEEEMKTKVNLSLFNNNNNNIGSDNNINSNTIKSSTNEKDSLSYAISDLGNMIQTLKKRSDSSQKLIQYKDISNSTLENNSSNNSNRISDSNSNNNSGIHPLHYNKTAGNKEKKFIEFTK